MNELNTIDEMIECLEHLRSGGELEILNVFSWCTSRAVVPDFKEHLYRPLVEPAKLTPGDRVYVSDEQIELLEVLK